MSVKEDFEKHATEKYGWHTVTNEGMSGKLSGRGYQDRKEDYYAGDKNGSKRTRKEVLEEIRNKMTKEAEGGTDTFTWGNIEEYIDTELKLLEE